MKHKKHLRKQNEDPNSSSDVAIADDEKNEGDSEKDGEDGKEEDSAMSNLEFLKENAQGKDFISKKCTWLDSTTVLSYIWQG